VERPVQLFGITQGRDYWLPKEFYALPCDGFTAILSETKRPKARRCAPKAAAKALLQHQRQLENLLACLDFLPAQPNLVFDGEHQVSRFLADDTDLLRSKLLVYGGLRQFQLVVSWPVEKALKELPQTHYGARYQELLGSDGTRRQIGEAIRDGMRQWRAELSNQIVERISGVTAESLSLPAEDDDVLCNMVALTHKDEVSLLEQSLEAVDALFGGDLRIKMIGPLPACSFASIGSSTADTAEDRAAMGMLNVAPGASAGDLRHAWLSKARAHHPDLVADSPLSMTSLNNAYQSLRKRLRNGIVPTPSDVPSLVIHRDPLLEGASQ